MNFMIKWCAVILVQMTLLANSALHRGLTYDYYRGHYYENFYSCDEVLESRTTCIIKNINQMDTPYINHENDEFFNELKFISCNFSQYTLDVLRTSKAFEYLEIVDLSESYIKELTTFQLESVDTLRTLILSRNEIEKLVEPSIFSKHSTLVTIDLSFNRISTIHPHVFDGLTELENLYLNNNEIIEIDELMFSRIYNLELLDLSVNQIETVNNDSFVALKHLKSLNLQENKLLEFDLNVLEYNTEMTELFIGNNSDFMSLSGDINVGSTLNITKVIYSDLTVNSDVVLITNSKISNIKLGNRTNVIEANNCSLTEILFDDENSNLRIVDFGRNNLKGDLKFENLKNLHTLDLSFNQITNISFVNTSALINLNLSKNNLTNIHNLNSMSELIKIDLSENCIQNFNLNTFSNLDNLEFLVLRKTCFKSLDFGTFSFQKKLKVLDISYNNLNRIDLDLFSSQSKLEVFFIEGNNLTNIQSIESISIHLPSLQSIALSHNEWSCTTLSSIIKILNQLKINVFVENVVRNKTNIKGISCTTLVLNSTQESIIIPQHSLAVNHTMYIKKIEQINEIVAMINEIYKRKKDSEFDDNSSSHAILNLKNRKNQMQKHFDNQINEMKDAANEILTKFELYTEMNYNKSMGLKVIVQKLNDTNNEKYELLLKRIDSLRDRLKMIKFNDVKHPDKSNEKDENVKNFNSKYHADIKLIESLEFYSIMFLILLLILALYYAWTLML